MINFLNRSIIPTLDGSKTVSLSESKECFHSVNGAYNESMHIFIDNGLLYKAKELTEINVLEVGMGTGLNVLLTIREAIEKKLKINYTAYELYPLSLTEISKLNYLSIVKFPDSNNYFRIIHEYPFFEKNSVCKDFNLLKMYEDVCSANFPSKAFDLIYFDAFSPAIQPELWSEDIFRKLFLSMKNNGVLLTYSCKGTVKRNLVAAGFNIEKLPGPLGKREILRARKNI